VIRIASRWRAFRFSVELPTEEELAMPGGPPAPDTPSDPRPESGRSRPVRRPRDHRGDAPGDPPKDHRGDDQGHRPEDHLGDDRGDGPELDDLAVLAWLRQSIAGLCAGEVGESAGEPVRTYRLARAATDAGSGGWAFERDGVPCLETPDFARAAHELIWQLGADAITVLDTLALHAGVLYRDGSALLLPAPSGSGKSTLVAALVQRGWTYGSDEGALMVPATWRSSGAVARAAADAPRGAQAGEPAGVGDGPGAASGKGTGDIPCAAVLAEGFPRPIGLDRSAWAVLGGIDALLPPALQALGLAEAHFPPARLAPDEGPRSMGVTEGSTGANDPAGSARADEAALRPGEALPVALVVFPRYAPDPPPAAPASAASNPAEQTPPEPARQGQTPPEPARPDQTPPAPSPGSSSGTGWVSTPLRPAVALLELVTNCFNLARFGQEGLETLAEVARAAPAHRLTHTGVGPAVEAIEALWAGRTTALVPAPSAPVPACADPHLGPARPAPVATEPAPADRRPTPGDQ